jgi:hypothetical protein
MCKTWPQDLIADLFSELKAPSPMNALRLGRIGQKLLELKYTLLKRGEVCASAYVEGIQRILAQIVDGHSRDTLADFTLIRQAAAVLMNMHTRNDAPKAQRQVPRRRVRAGRKGKEDPT